MLYLSPDIQTTAPWHAPNLSGYPVRLKWYTYENTHTLTIAITDGCHNVVKCKINNISFYQLKVW